MNLSKVILVLAIVLCFVEPAAIHAQGIRLGGPSPMEALLTPAQKMKLDAIKLKMRKDMHAVSIDATLSKPQKEQKEKALVEQYNNNVKSLLTPAQQNKVHKFAELDRQASQLNDESVQLQHQIYVTLTADQKAKLAPIRQERADWLNKIIADKTLTDAQRKQKNVQCDLAINRQTRKILTPSQQVQFDKAWTLIQQMNALHDQEK